MLVVKNESTDGGPNNRELLPKIKELCIDFPGQTLYGEALTFFGKPERGS
jgi:hypothetical protein